MWCLIFSLLMSSAVYTFGLDFCSKNLLPHSKMTNSLQFTKELSLTEFAVESRFKSLHCCSKGYLSIEWFKDGRPYPWPSDVSSFILYPEAANQTIYTKVLSPSDAGNYTCRLHNDTSHQVHSTQLKVFDATGYTGHPLATYRPSNVSLAQIGWSTRIFCEAFVGHIDLPDANNEVKWEKDRGGGSLKSAHVTIDHTSREKGQIVGAYLTIHDIEETDFGTYSCSISNTGDQEIVMMTELRAFDMNSNQLCVYNELMLIFGVAITIVLLGVFLFTKKWRTNQISFLRLFVGKISEVAQNWNKKRDRGTIILYSEGNELFVEETLLPTLRNQSTLCPCPLRLSHEWGLTEDNKELCRRVKKIIVILSPQCVKQWSCKGINEFLENLAVKEADYCLILLEALPDAIETYGALCGSQSSRYTLVNWNEHTFNENMLFKNNRTNEESPRQYRFPLPNFALRRLRSTSTPAEVQV